MILNTCNYSSLLMWEDQLRKINQRCLSNLVYGSFLYYSQLLIQPYYENGRHLHH